jgi:hypothetical protein
MSIVIDIQEHPTLRVRCLTARKLTTNSICTHGLVKQWCAVCNPTEQAPEPVIDFLNDGCLICGAEIEQPTGRGRKRIYCNEHYRDADNRNGARNRFQLYKDRLEDANNTVALGHLRRFKYMSFDGRYEGPSALCFTVVTNLRFDRGFKAMPIDEHVKPSEARFTTVTPEDVEWGFRQSSQHARWATSGDGARTAYPPSRNITEPLTNFCPHCTVETQSVVMKLKREYWMDKGRLVHEDKVVPERVTKITRGKYVLQGHVCNHG